MATTVYNYLASEVFLKPIAQFYQQFEREAQKKLGKSWKQINAQCEDVYVFLLHPKVVFHDLKPFG